MGPIETTRGMKWDAKRERETDKRPVERESTSFGETQRDERRVSLRSMQLAATLLS